MKKKKPNKTESPEVRDAMRAAKATRVVWGKNYNKRIKPFHTNIIRLKKLMFKHPLVSAKSLYEDWAKDNGESQIVKAAYLSAAVDIVISEGGKFNAN